ncbi:MAG TPA: helix-turn-helix domain-containing protein [Candidatus Saccharimonadales bacterium]|nr:helix-turn-helix domain-containing protein [Candidatus Saccharimonadales bacterium]
METLFNVNQVAYILKVHPLTVRRYIKEGKLKAVKIEGNIRIKEAQLQGFNAKDYTPKPQTSEDLPEKKVRAKVFAQEDPFLRLQGRGASLHLG